MGPAAHPIVEVSPAVQAKLANWSACTTDFVCASGPLPQYVTPFFPDLTFSWSSAGPVANQLCTQISEPSDPDTWNDNYLCSNAPHEMQWSYAGPIANMRCTQVNEPAEPASHAWSDNYLCY